MEFLQNIGSIILFGFLFGAFFSVGVKTVEAIWPDKPQVVKHVVEE